MNASDGTAEHPDAPQLFPLLPGDPPRVDAWWLQARLTASVSGVAYLGADADGSEALVVLLSQGAASDGAAVDRFAGTVNQLHIDTVLARGGRGQDTGRLAHRFRPVGDVPVTVPGEPAPWVALAHDGTPEAVAEANRILAAVDLSWLPPKGTPSGPGYRLPWVQRTEPGEARVWPLPWPGRGDRAGWLSILLSWLIMMLLMVLAVLIAILLFQATPPQPPPPPVPTSASGSGSPPPDSASPSPDSASPSPDSASPSPASASPSPSGGSPSPNSRL